MLLQKVPIMDGLWCLGIIRSEKDWTTFKRFIGCDRLNVDYSRTVHPFEKMGAEEWHRDVSMRYFIATCLRGPGTLFTSKIVAQRSGRYVTFPPGYLALIDNTKIVHRTPPWLRTTRKIYRLDLSGSDLWPFNERV